MMRSGIGVLVWGAAIALILATLADIGVLWILQRMPTTEWEFIAVSRSLDQGLNLIAGFGFAGVGIGLGSGRYAKVALRAVGGFALLCALGAFVLEVLMIMDYLALRGDVTPESGGGFNGTVAKALLLGTLYALVLLFGGISALRSASNQ